MAGLPGRARGVVGAQDGAGTRPRTGRPRGSRGTWDRVFRRKYPGGLGAALGSGSSSRGPRFPPPEGVVESVAQVLGSWDDRRMRGVTGRTRWPLHEQPFLPPSRWALGGFARERASTASLPRPHTDGARPPPGPGRLQASALSGELASHLLASLPTAAEPAPRAQGSPLRTAWEKKVSALGVQGARAWEWGADSSARGVLCSPEVLTPMPGALSGVSSRLGVIRPPLPAQASRRLRQPSVTGIPATWARAAPETPLARRLRRAAANTCGGRGPAPRSAQASPAARPEQLITPAPGREALPGPLFSTCLPGACE